MSRSYYPKTLQYCHQGFLDALSDACCHGSDCLPRPSTLSKMEDRKRPAVSSADDLAPPSKRVAINGSKLKDEAPDMKEESWVEVCSCESISISSARALPYSSCRSILGGLGGSLALPSLSLLGLATCRPEAVLAIHEVWMPRVGRKDFHSISALLHFRPSLISHATRYHVGNIGGNRSGSPC